MKEDSQARFVPSLCMSSVEVPPFAIRRSNRARSVHVSVDAVGEIEVVLPHRMPKQAALDAVVELTPWIERRRRALAAARAELNLTPGELPYLGAGLRLVCEPGRQRVHRRDDVLLIPQAGTEQALERWYRRAARAEVTRRLDRACSRVGSTYTSLTIRDQRTRWGSCSAEGGMSFNWRLLLAPEAVLDYVIEHEVCHLEILDHSPRFWSLLTRRFPDWRAQARWLRRYGPLLSRPLTSF